VLLITGLGLVAAALTTYSSVPQIRKMWVTKKTGDVSLQMYVILAAGFTMWLAYGVAISSVPIVVANCFNVVLASMIVALKVRYG
jgi:MtN3 and saliva related transmembrane protein